MIETPTVLILGAGASRPYGFWLGRELLFKVVEGLEVNGDINNKLRQVGFDAEELLTFQDQLQKSMQPSVDAFLERRPEFLEIGKAAIATALMPYEQEVALLPRENEPRWYEYLFTKLDAGPERFEQNQLSIITFNYDRSLEQFLFLALKNSYGFSDSEVVKLLRSVPIIHVHGQLGPAAFEAGGRQYASPFSNDEIRLTAAGIRIAHETAEDDEQFGKARDRLASARKICFLGFGYHPANVKRLRLDNLKHGPIMIACTNGLTEQEQNGVFGMIGGVHRSGSEEALMFLRTHPVLE